MESGVVYILSNQALAKNLLKVGMTTLTAVERAKQISRHEGVPKEYEVLWYKEVPNIALAENALHYFLHKYAYNKEFFELEPSLAVGICREAMYRIFEPIDLKKVKQTETKLKYLRKRAKELSFDLKIDDTKKSEVETYIEEKKNEISILPIGSDQTNWQSVADSLNYNFGKKAIQLILKEKKKGDPIRKRFISYRTNYWWCEAIHVFFTKKHISIYLKTDRADSVTRTLKKYFSAGFQNLDLKKISEGLSFKVKTEKDFNQLVAFLQMGEKRIMQMPLRHK